MALEEALSGPIGPIGAGLEEVNVQGPAGGIQVQDPQVIEQNKGLWRGFFQKMKEDPNFKQAVLMTGIQMLRTPKMGETGWDVASNALQGGVMTLEGLRQRDFERTQAGEEQKLKERQVAVQERGAATQESTAETYRKATEGQTKQSQDAYELKKKELEEAIRSNQANEAIARLRAEAETLRAKAYSSGTAGRTPGEIQKINDLAAKFMRNGMDEIDARDAAVRYVQETGKGSVRDIPTRAFLLADSLAEAYDKSLAALDKPRDAAMTRAFREQAIEIVQEEEKILKGPQSTTTGGPIARGGAPIDEQLLAQVKAAVQAGKDVTAIRQRIIQLGHDPAAYGL